ncbi:hypothetical protein C5749_01630 [Sphingobacterium gobiense]|uniref:SnoaL-like domain-containing protein n=2 Tax=Sphingobacterium gobiense TaxID=1382456 RepID=A0A2S9JVS5_9SPHI|nr:hypothetical protein C5749_01630 [Sphingobacterium gobiense]
MKEEIIQEYINAYNSKDVNKMIENLSDDVLFENISNHEVTLSIQGKDAFREQAITALSYFSTRKQTILKTRPNGNSVEIDIDYEAIAAMDFPNGIKKGDKVKLKGKSIFEFSQNGKIVKLTDIS